MNPSYYKYCVVPLCKSTTVKTPNKLFVYVPNKKHMREKWLRLARRSNAHSLSKDSRMYFCEDHFDLPNDMVNYMEYHVMGTVSQVRMNPGCIPSKFECQEGRRNQTMSKERPCVAKKRGILKPESLEESAESSTSTSSIKNTSDASSSVTPQQLYYIPNPQENTNMSTLNDNTEVSNVISFQHQIKCEELDLGYHEVDINSPGQTGIVKLEKVDISIEDCSGKNNAIKLEQLGVGDERGFNYTVDIKCEPADKFDAVDIKTEEVFIKCEPDTIEEEDTYTEGKADECEQANVSNKGEVSSSEVDIRSKDKVNIKGDLNIAKYQIKKEQVDEALNVEQVDGKRYLIAYEERDGEKYLIKFERGDTDSDNDSDNACMATQTTADTDQSVNETTQKEVSSQDIFTCDICSEQYRHKRSLKRHLLKHPQKIYSCSECNFKTCQQWKYTNHFNNDHSDKFATKCPHCDFKSYYKPNLDEHINIKHTRSSVFSCAYCPFKVYSKNSLKKHINAKHTQRNVYKCPYCSYTTFYKSHLGVHINVKHTKRTVFNCTYCSYKSYSKTSLEKHVNCKHTHTKVYNCSFCTFKSYRSTDLNIHVNSQHTKTNVYKCAECDFKAYRKSDVRTHVNTKHTKSISFNCRLCEYKTFNRRLLYSHVKNRHS